MPGARCTRGLVCNSAQRNAHEHTGTDGTLRHSLRKGAYGRRKTNQSSATVVFTFVSLSDVDRAAARNMGYVDAYRAL